MKATLENGLTDGWIIGSKEGVYECKDNADQVTFGSIWEALKERKHGRRSKRVPALPLDSRLRVRLFLSDRT